MSENNPTSPSAVEDREAFLSTLIGDTIEQNPEDTFEVVHEIEQPRSDSLYKDRLRPNTINPAELKQYIAYNAVQIEPIAPFPVAHSISPVLQALQAIDATPRSKSESAITSPDAPIQSNPSSSFGQPVASPGPETPNPEPNTAPSTRDTGGDAQQLNPNQRMGSGAIRGGVAEMVGSAVGGIFTGAGVVAQEGVNQIGRVASATAEAAGSIARGGYDAVHDTADHISNRRNERVSRQLNAEDEVENPSLDMDLANIQEKIQARRSANPEGLASIKASQLERGGQELSNETCAKASEVLGLSAEEMADKNAVKRALDNASPEAIEKLRALDTAYAETLKNSHEEIAKEVESDPEFLKLSEDDQAKYLKELKAKLDSAKTLNEEQSSFLDALKNNGFMGSAGDMLKNLFGKAKDSISDLMSRLAAKLDMGNEVEARASQGVSQGL